MDAAHNPFRTSRIHAVPYRPLLSREQTFARLQAFNYRALIAGDYGHGKSAFLRQVGLWLYETGQQPLFLLLNEAHPRLTPAQWQQAKDCRDIILLDGAECLSYPRWLWFRWLTRQAQGLIITHQHVCRLPLLLELQDSEELLEYLLSHLLPDMDAATTALSKQLLSQYHGDLRMTLRALYDEFAQRS